MAEITSDTQTSYPQTTDTTPWRQRQSSQERIRRIGSIIVIFPLAAFFILPFIWMLSTSLKVPNQIFIFPPQWIPDPIMWSNYPESLTKWLPFDLFFWNSFKISINAVIGNLVSCTMVAYAFSHLRGRGKNFLFLTILGFMALPQEVTLIPQYILFTQMGWNNTHLPLMVPPWFGWPFFIFLLRQFFMTIPRDYVEAARIDGANSMQILLRIMVPMTKPALATVAIFSFIGNWNNFLGPLLYLRDEELLTASIGLLQFQGQFGNIDYHLMMAVAVVAIVPVLIVFTIGQRTFVQGIALTGVKG